MKPLKSILTILLCTVVLLFSVFLIGRYGWKLGGFSICESAGIEQVNVEEDHVRIRGFYPGSWKQRKTESMSVWNGKGKNKEMKGKMKKRFFITACVLSVAAVGFAIFAMGHSELSFPWDNWVTGILYGLYADTVVLLFILAFGKKMTLLNILSIILLLGAVFFLVQSILNLFPDGHINWCLPLAQGLTCIALFLNLAQIRKNRQER